MAASDVINGTDVMVFMSPSSGTTTWTVIGHATSHSLSIDVATRDTSNKGTAAYETSAAGRIKVTGTIEGLYMDDDKYNLEDLMTAILAREPMLMIFGREASAGVPDTTTTGKTHFYCSGQFILSNLQATFPDQENSTYTATITHHSGFVMNQLITS